MRHAHMPGLLLALPLAPQHNSSSSHPSSSSNGCRLYLLILQMSRLLPLLLLRCRLMTLKMTKSLLMGTWPHLL
jgi:hypothetical protein